jgi:predicted transposase/invertase (TIGR01784 family)
MIIPESILSNIKSEFMSTYDVILEKGIEKGSEKGIEKGIEKGEHKKAKEMILKAFEKGIDVESIAFMSGYTIDQVKDILKSGINNN